MSSPAYRLVATDLDGTIVRSDGTVSDRTRDALGLAERAGALVVFVTGRPPRWMAPIAEATGHRGLAVCANGALVYDLHAERVVEQFPLQASVVAAVVEELRRELPDAAFAVERGDSGFFHEEAYRSPWATAGDAVPVSELVREGAAKLLCRHAELGPDALLARARDVVGELAELTHSSRDGLIEISATGVSKATTLKRLSDERGIDATDVLAFGDMPNDLPLLAWAGRSVGVANAHPDVLAAVDEVTASNDEDGVAAVLERLFAG